jgi:uncharacterized iron-regulated protein
MKSSLTALLVTFLFAFSLSLHAQNDQAFVIYNAKGKKVSYKKMKKKVLEGEYVFFGEYHDNPISHWLQFELLKDLHAKHGTSLKIAFEMLEQDQQMRLNDFMISKISDKEFKDSMRLWPNYKTDYQPIVQYAKENGLFCLASNVPRKYASLLFKKGRAALDTLSEVEKAYMAPLDFVVDSTLSQYAALLEAGQHMGGNRLMEAQAFKDATMAHFMKLNKRPGDIFYHLNGAYHSDFHQGIMWYVQQFDAQAKFVTISTVTQETSIKKLDKEHLGRADFIICVPESMTRTH